MVRGRRPKAVFLAYNQGDGVFHFEVVSRDDREVLLVSLRENKLDGKIARVALDEHEATVLISKLFEGLLNLQARQARRTP